jgi:hypothetical protein
MWADSENAVIDILSQAGYWHNAAAWRLYGDIESNYSTIGNQQSRPDAALVEKLVNSVDARLMNECLVRGIDPEGTQAPQTIQRAVALFFDEGARPDSPTAGRIREWPEAKRTEVARGITLSATGAKPGDGKPCFTISDSGEGQSSAAVPLTLLSLPTGKSNKVRIPFVQGKFNMGSTGVLKFCGHNNLQLILTRRNPAIVKRTTGNDSDSDWSFTIVRREDPEGSGRSSIYTYLAPTGADRAPNSGEVLRFSADKMSIFPEGRNAYSRSSGWGTLIKLYEYAAAGYSNTHILRRDGLLSRLDLLLPDVALPIRLHECRSGYRGHDGSFETTLTGVGVRLEDDKAENLEIDPSSCPLTVNGQEMTATIYAFKKGKADTYRRGEGLIFTFNGQTHGSFPTDFFRRKSVGLSYLADSILVVVECSKISGRAREDLFMNSRDRLSGVALRAAIEEELADLLRHHQGLRDLKERRRQEEISARLEDSKPLEDILKSLLQKSPTLSALFLRGMRLSNPFNTVKVKGAKQPYKGKRYPSFFKFKDKNYGETLHRDCHLGSRCRIAFETDAANDYFSRDVDPGESQLWRVDGAERIPVENRSLIPNDGIATLNLQLPTDCAEGDVLRLIAAVTDPSRVEPFENTFELKINDAKRTSSGGKGGIKKPPTKEEGIDREIPLGIQLPNITRVYEHGNVDRKGWLDVDPAFNKYSALRIRHAGSTADSGENGAGTDVYDFFVNVDNLYLKTEMKLSGQEPQVPEARFVYGMVLLGLALLHQDANTKKAVEEVIADGFEGRNAEASIEEKVEEFSKAVAPVLLPMIDSLGEIDLEENQAFKWVGADA